LVHAYISLQIPALHNLTSHTLTRSLQGFSQTQGQFTSLRSTTCGNTCTVLETLPSVLEGVSLLRLMLLRLTRQIDERYRFWHFVVSIGRRVRACTRLSEPAKALSTRNYVRGISGPSTLLNATPSPTFFGAADASFGDDIETRRLSAGYVFML
jgi:hypothetical protein